MRMRRGEEGAALLAVLLLVALIATLAALAVDRLGLATHLTANARSIDQARAYAFGAEALVTLIVDDLTDRSGGSVRLPAGWREEVRTIPVEGGIIHARIHDGGNCFNLNSLVEGNVSTGWKARQQGMVRFLTLLEIVGVSESQARPIVAAATDWIDSDTEPQPLGAEDRAYANAAVPYRTANALMADPSELRTVAGVTPEIYRRVRPWVCALPNAEPSVLNVNILQPEQAPLVAMLYDGRLGLSQAAALLRDRPPGGWASSQQFLQSPQINALASVSGLAGEVDVRTHWFTLDLDVALDGAQVKERALIDGRNAPARVLMRRWGSGE
ncbi:general secretion pathway protein K [Sphingomonas sp. YR710]|nr:general secretion pathway protein K [Sphingomonas sp. YR710]